MQTGYFHWKEVKYFSIIVDYHENFYLDGLLSEEKYKKILQACMEFDNKILEVHENWRAKMYLFIEKKGNYPTEDEYFDAIAAAYVKLVIDNLN